ncbi:succinate dehydrogenase, cytochrome b556 subunit, partial [Klebsiella pneumoniae]
MAQARSNRPISPHLQIWRWGPAMLVSILHRVTGNGLAFAGLGLLLWWI